MTCGLRGGGGGVFLTVWHWDSPFTCISLSFHIYKVG